VACIIPLSSFSTFCLKRFVSMPRLTPASLFAFAVAVLFSLPLAAQPAVETPSAAPAKPAAAAKPVDDKRKGQIRDRWSKLSPEKKDEIRKKAEQRLDERYGKLQPAEQKKIEDLLGEVEKLSKEERSVFLAKLRQKSSKAFQQKKKMKELETTAKEAPAEKAPAEKPAVEKPAAEKAPAETAPAAPAETPAAAPPVMVPAPAAPAAPAPAAPPAPATPAH
jgi:pyruvate dehydrogenase E2 component (dihydrolipoamide acetyltransferase)